MAHLELLPVELVELVLMRCAAKEGGSDPAPSSFRNKKLVKTTEASLKGKAPYDDDAAVTVAEAIDLLLTGAFLSRVCRPLLHSALLPPVLAAQQVLLSSQVDGCFSSAASRLGLPPATALSAALFACGGKLPPNERLLLWAADAGHLPALRLAATNLDLDHPAHPGQILFPVLSASPLSAQGAATTPPLLHLRSTALRRRVLELAGRGGHASVLSSLANQGLLVHLPEGLIDADPVTGPSAGRTWPDGLRAAVHAAAGGHEAMVVALLCHSCCALGAEGHIAQRHLGGWLGIVLRSAAWHGQVGVLAAVHALFAPHVGRGGCRAALRAAQAGGSRECAEWLTAVLALPQRG